MKRNWRGPLGLALVTMALWMGQASVAPTAALAQQPAPVSFGADEQEIALPARKFRFAVPGDWKVQSQNGIYVIQSADQKLLMVLVLLDKPEELPAALQELDKMVVVTGAQFGTPHTTIQGLIPMQMMAGAGTLQPQGQKIELLSVTANVVERPVLTMFYVHADAAPKLVPMAQKVIQTFGLMLTREEAEAVKKAQAERQPGSSTP